MKILIFTTQIYQLGGAEKLAIELVHGLNKNNIETHLAVLYESKSYDDEKLIFELKRDELYVNKYHLLKIYPNPGINDIFKAVLKIKKILKAEKYDYIETSMITPSIIATLATLSGKCRHIIGFHQSFQEYMYKDPKYKLFAFLTWVSSQNIYYGISDFVINSWRNAKWFNVKKKTSYTLYNNISEKLDTIPKDAYTKPSLMKVAGKKILCVGRLTTLKGYHILYEAIKNDLERLNWHLYFVGEKHNATAGDDETFRYIKNDIDRLQIAQRVNFVSFTTKVVNYMKHCDLLVHPTGFEGFGLVIVEAMRLRVPIITTNVEAIPEITEGTGILQVGYSDINGLRKAIYKHFNEFQEEQKNVIERAYEKSFQFTLQKRVDKFIEILDKKCVVSFQN